MPSMLLSSPSRLKDTFVPMRAELYALLAQLDLRDKGPDLTPDKSLQADPTPYLIMLVAGFVIGTLGHLTRTKFMIALGILLIMLATVILPIIYAVQNN